MHDEQPRYQTVAWTAMRIALGLMFWSHGAQKLLGWLGGFGRDGGTAELFTRFGAAGVLEFVGGSLIVLGLFTRPTAFVLAGEMAVAYFWMHVAGGGLWWWANSGEKAAMYAFVFLALAAFGAGRVSVDALLARRRGAGSAPATTGAPPAA